MKIFAPFICIFLSGCAGIDFDSQEKGALVYYELKPYLFVSTTDKCISTATVVSIPSVAKKMKFTSGFGASSLSAEFSNGIITKVGQTSDTKIPETLSSIAALATAGIVGDQAADGKCESAALYPIVNGVPDIHQPLAIPIGK